MSKSQKNTEAGTSTICVNKKAHHDYFITDRFEAGIVLEGWEVKSLREGRVQLTEAYVLLKDGAAWLFGMHIPPLITASTHIHPDPTRTRKLLLHQKELNKLYGSVERKGFTLIPLSMYFKRGLAKLDIGLAKGKKEYDKRATDKERSWQRDKARLIKAHK